MDHRIALKSNTPLRLCNEKGEAIHCVIEKEIGRGGSCIVYEAARVTDTGDKTLYRVKEFYPYKLDILRDKDNTLIPSPKDEEIFCEGQQQLRIDFSRTNQLFYSDSNYSLMTNQLDVFTQNGTSYILSAYSSKKTLAAYQPESLKECIMLVRQVAYVLEKIHRQGYLYLDTKPDNVLIVDGYQKQIQLFDFDSLLSIQDIKDSGNSENPDMRLSYSKGFASLELQTSKIKRLGFYTDVYSVGALLFYLLFGYTPNAPDCEMDAGYDFSKIRFDYRKCDDRLFQSLKVFFHNTLAVYYADRYQKMQEAVERLQEIETFSDFTIPRIYSTSIYRIPKPKIFYGRENAFEALDRFIENPEESCLFLTGMGGIGKSTLARAYLLSRRDRFDTMLYIPYKDSIDATISDDNNIEINTLRQEEADKDGVRYFDRKLKKIRELVRGSSAVLVIDNFTGAVDEDFLALCAAELKIIFISRQAPVCRNCQELKLSAVSDTTALRFIFEANLGRRIAEEEYAAFEKIVHSIEGHTLVLELIAKQIASSHITVASAAALAEKHGFSEIAPEKVAYEKDSSLSKKTIGNIIDALFELDALSATEKALMKVASLVGNNGMDIHLFQQIMRLPSKDDLNQLIEDGWLMLSDHMIFMHHVIREFVHRWEWIPEYIAAAEQFLTHFYTGICRESTGNDIPQKLKKPSDGEDVPADPRKLASLLLQSEDIIRQCKREPALKTNDMYINLLHVTVLNTPYYREKYILAETCEIFSDCEAALLQNGTAVYTVENGSRNPVTIMQLYAVAVLIHADNKRFAEAEKLLVRAKRFAMVVRHRKIYALYYNLLSDYYDILLDGFYDSEEPEKRRLLYKMLNAMDKTLHYSKRRHFVDENHLYAKNLLAKATVLMRSGRGSDRKVGRLIRTAQKIIMKNTSRYADVRLHYYLVCAWYFALLQGSIEGTDRFVASAQELSDTITPSDIKKIEDLFIPCANMYFELECYDKAMDFLLKGIRLCKKYPNNDAYARIKQELCEHLWEVGIAAQEFALCKKLMEQMEGENEEIIDPKNKVVISDEVRRIIAGSVI